MDKNGKTINQLDLYNHQSRDVIGDTPIYDNFTGKMWFKFSRGQNWIANSQTKLA